MDRPDDISPFELALWEEGFREVAPSLKIPGVTSREMVRELFFAGEWIDARLARLGLDHDERSRACQAAGQGAATLVMAGAGKYVWSSHRAVLDYYRASGTVAPGPELAAELMDVANGIYRGDHPWLVKLAEIVAHAAKDR